MFDEVKGKGGIEMLCVLLENGEWTLEWEGCIQNAERLMVGTGTDD